MGMKFDRLVVLLVLLASCDALHNIGAVDQTGADGGTDGTAQECPSDLFATVGLPCSPEGKSCNNCTDRCQFCNLIQCWGGKWAAVEALPDPNCQPDMGLASTPWTAASSGTSRSLSGVWGSGDKIFAVGNDGTILLSSDWGAHWQDASPPSGWAGGLALSAVWGSGSNFFAVDSLSSKLLRTSDARNWALADVQPPIDHGRAIWGTDASDFYVAGYSSVKHFSSGGWYAVWLDEISNVDAITGWSGGISGVLFGGADQIHAGIQEQISRQKIYTRVLDQAKPGYVQGLWADDGTNGYAVGTENGGALLFSNRNLAGWQRVSGGDADMLESSGQPLTGVFGDGTTVFAVGFGGTIFNWNTLKVESSGTTQHLRAIWGAAGHFVAVGDNGTILVKTVQ